MQMSPGESSERGVVSPTGRTMTPWPAMTPKYCDSCFGAPSIRRWVCMAMPGFKSRDVNEARTCCALILMSVFMDPFASAAWSFQA